MRLVLHILKKDLRRFWPAALATSFLVAVLARFDRWRADWNPSPTEGWLNLIVPAAWACLIALAVLEEPLVESRHVWMTRPYRWSSLLAAKLAFGLLTVHVPLLLAGLYVLSQRGFSPELYAADLLSKQAGLFFLITLPATGLATLVRNFTQFVIALFAIGAALILFNRGLASFPSFVPQPSGIRDALGFCLFVAAALAAVLVQYAGRRTMAARAAGITLAGTAAAISAFLPVRAEYTFQAPPPSAAPRLVQRSAERDAALFYAHRWPRPRTVLLPIAVEILPSNALLQVPFFEVEIMGANGARIRSTRPVRGQPLYKMDLMAYPMSESRDTPPPWLVLSFSNAAWDRISGGPVRIIGSAGFQLYRRGATTVLTSDGSVDTPDAGRCTALTVDDRYSESLLKVLCESPGELPRASIVLRHQPSGRFWPQTLNSAFTYTSGPNSTWLSPLRRAQTFFRLSDVPQTTPGAQWLVPPDLISESRIEITPEFPAGLALSHFEFNAVDLSPWLVR